MAGDRFVDIGYVFVSLSQGKSSLLLSFKVAIMSLILYLFLKLDILIFTQRSQLQENSRQNESVERHRECRWTHLMSCFKEMREMLWCLYNDIVWAQLFSTAAVISAYILTLIIHQRSLLKCSDIINSKLSSANYYLQPPSSILWCHWLFKKAFVKY